MDYFHGDKLTLINKYFIIRSKSSYKMIDLSLKSQSWVTSLLEPLVYRNHCGFGVLDDCLYSVSLTYYN